MSSWEKFRKGYGAVPSALQPVVARALSVLLGLALAVLLHYLLYRFGLPSKPFIYVAF
jgi:hypothetical protein